MTTREKSATKRFALIYNLGHSFAMSRFTSVSLTLWPVWEKKKSFGGQMRFWLQYLPVATGEDLLHCHTANPVSRSDHMAVVQANSPP